MVLASLNSLVIDSRNGYILAPPTSLPHPHDTPPGALEVLLVPACHVSPGCHHDRGVRPGPADLAVRGCPAHPETHSTVVSTQGLERAVLVTACLLIQHTGIGEGSISHCLLAHTAHRDWRGQCQSLSACSYSTQGLERAVSVTVCLLIQHTGIGEGSISHCLLAHTPHRDWRGQY